MKSLSFDRVADSYDATRGYRPDVARQIATAIISAGSIAPGSSVLEVGIGTGRIAYPILSQVDCTYTGVDIAWNMMGICAEKFQQDGWISERLDQKTQYLTPPEERKGSLSLIEADMTSLPFPDATFDNVIAVHIFHLVAGWEKAVDEILRVLKPCGSFIHCWDEYLVTEMHKVEDAWIGAVEQLGGKVKSVGASNRRYVDQYLERKGYKIQEIRPVRWEEQVTPRQVLSQITNRIWSKTWLVPDDIFNKSIPLVEEWAEREYRGVMDLPHNQVKEFVMNRADSEKEDE